MPGLIGGDESQDLLLPIGECHRVSLVFLLLTIFLFSIIHEPTTSRKQLLILA